MLSRSRLLIAGAFVLGPPRCRRSRLSFNINRQVIAEEAVPAAAKKGDHSMFGGRPLATL